MFVGYGDTSRETGFVHSTWWSSSFSCKYHHQSAFFLFHFPFLFTSLFHFNAPQICMTQLSFPAISTLIPLKSSLGLDLAPLSSLSSNLHFLQSLNYKRDNCTINTPTLHLFLIEYMNFIFLSTLTFSKFSIKYFHSNFVNCFVFAGMYFGIYQRKIAMLVHQLLIFLNQLSELFIFILYWCSNFFIVQIKYFYKKKKKNLLIVSIYVAITRYSFIYFNCINNLYVSFN